MNKLWYKQDRFGKIHNNINYRYYLSYRNCIQEMIEMYYYQTFEVPEDITIDGLDIFVDIILKQYQIYNIHFDQLVNFGEAVLFYLAEAYEEEFPDGFSGIDSRAECIVNYCMEWGYIWHPLPEDVDFVLECLYCFDYNGADTHDALNRYFKQFDFCARVSEYNKRWEAIRKERIEALEKGKPLPIKPMSITLDPCYKEKSN